MLQSSVQMRATRKLKAFFYIQEVIGSIYDRRVKYPRAVVDNILADLRLRLIDTERFIAGTAAGSVNYGADTFPEDDELFIQKVVVQLRLIEAVQMRVRPQAQCAQLTALFADVFRLFGLFSDAVDRRRDHLRERQNERARADANGLPR